MKRVIKKIAIILGLCVIAAYGGICGWIFFNQDKILFQPVKVEPNFHYTYKEPFREVNYKTKTGKRISALLFKNDKPKGVIYYLHGSGGNLSNLENLPLLATQNGYDLVAIDYPGFGKSTGSIEDEKGFIEVGSQVYRALNQSYGSNNIVVYGYSFGTGIATAVIQKNRTIPKMLILEAPFFNYPDLMEYQFPWWLPSSIITDYKFNLNEQIKNVRCPIYIFHGKKDTNISYESSVKLKKSKKDIRLFILAQADHFTVKESTMFKKYFKDLLLKH